MSKIMGTLHFSDGSERQLGGDSPKPPKPLSIWLLLLILLAIGCAAGLICGAVHE